MAVSCDTALDMVRRVLAADSPTGYTVQATDLVMDLLSGMGFSPVRTRKGCVVCTLGGDGHPLVLSAHVDTLGLMVHAVKPSGTLAFTRIGGPSFSAVETENVTVMTREGKRYSGVVQLCNASIHVNRELDTVKHGEDTMEILLDELVTSAKDVQELGIAPGDYVFLDPRTRVTESGFIHSRFLDDKLSAGMLLALAQAVADGEVKPARKITLFFSVYEEVGHGASAGLPQDTEDMLVVDMGCVGDGISCRETQVSICAKDSGGPYDYFMTGELIELAKKNGIDYAVDTYPYYGSDAGAALEAGRDIRFALIGSGVYASHGYERTHMKGVENTLKLIEAYVTKA